MHPSLDLRQLHAFVTVVEVGQITRAAERLHIAQPALSQQISKLEVSVGTRLLDRHPRGVSPTPAGAVFLEKARATLEAAAEAQAVLGPWLREETALCVGYFSSLQTVARPILRRYMEAYPSVNVDVRHLNLSDRLVALKRGEIDAEFLLPPPLDPSLVVETVMYSPRYVLLNERHPLAGEGSLVFEQIANETFPGRHPSVPEKWAEDAWLINYRGSDPPMTAEMPVTVDELWALIYAGKAIAVLPEFMVSPTAGDGVRAVPLADVEPLEVGLARRADDARLVVENLFGALHPAPRDAPDS
jgi:DNA-binding transcriptional LysR family regulator